ncbi:MAG: TonB-dependent receptor [Crocinitomicaceae bacterium]|nr:MAG: TonB-dependent receptor [Crocinitomicaceae bacterium]
MNSFFQTLLVFIFTCGFTHLLVAQGNNSTLSGTITYQASGETIHEARISIPSINLGTNSNEYGFYSLTVPKGIYDVYFKAPGMKTIVQKMDLNTDQKCNVELADESEVLDEVEVNARKGENVSSTKIGQMELEMEKIKTLPAFMGEVDIIKTIQLLPGVSSVSEGGQGFYVRGGGPDQNLVLVDEAQVYNASHLFGFFSVFNSDAVKSVNMIKGGMPANFGGRISSVLEVKMNEGNNKQFKVKGGLGLISSRLTIEGPIVKDKSSFIFSARRTYIDVLMKTFIPKNSAFSGSGYYFYDLNFKANYRLSKKDKLFLSAYYGKDQFTFGNKNDDFSVQMPWGNAVASLRWNRIFSSKLFMNVTATFTDYLFSFGSEQDDFKFKLSSGIRDWGGKADFSYFPSTRHRLKFGVEYLYHTFTPTSVSASQNDTQFDTGEAQQLFSHETAFYALDEYDVNDKIRINAGIRYSMYQFVGPFKRFINNSLTGDTVINYGNGELIHFYQGFEPRISGRWMVGKSSSIKGGFAYNYQYVHLTSLSAVSLPTDIWFPTTDIAKPQRGWQASLGYFQNFLNDRYEASIEIYYKGMNNLIEYKQGALPADNVNDNTDNLLVFGTGWSYGAEFFVKKAVGKFTGWIGYTWAKTERKFPDLQVEVFPAKYDRRHDLTVVGSYKLNDRWTFGASFIYASGNTLTLPSSWYIQDQNILFNYGLRNSTRMAPYHRLDISATWYDKPTKAKTNPETGETMQVKKKFRSNWNFSIYNVYNRANPYFLYVDNEGGLLTNDFKISVKQVTLFPIIPSATWNFEF